MSRYSLTSLRALEVPRQLLRRDASVFMGASGGGESYHIGCRLH